MEIEIDLIRPSPYQPRLTFNLDELKQEIKKDGLLSELVVRKRGEFYEIIDGERRWRALKELGWKTIPAQVVDIDNMIARRSVYKLNKIRENYTVEEEARYFRKLTYEGLTPWEISKELNVDFHWVLAHLNVFKFPEDIQNAVWTGQISVSHMVALESVIGRNMEEALVMTSEILKRKLTLPETRKIISERETKIEEMRIKAAEEVLPKLAPKVAKLKTPEDIEKAAKALKKMAKKKREETMTPEEKTAIEAEKERKLEERRRKWDERRKSEQRRIEEEARKMARQLQEEERLRIEKEAKKAIGVNIEEGGLIQTLKGLREKIKTLEREKARLSEMRDDFLAKALQFNCPYCNHPCTIYREGDRYWVE